MQQGSTLYHNLHISTCTHTKSWKRWRILLGRAQLQSQRYSTNLLHSLFMELIQEQEGLPQGKPCICICTKSLLLTDAKSALKFLWKEKRETDPQWKKIGEFLIRSPWKVVRVLFVVTSQQLTIGLLFTATFRQPFRSSLWFPKGHKPQLTAQVFEYMA